MLWFGSESSQLLQGWDMFKGGYLASNAVLDRSAATGEGQPKPKPKSTELLQSSGGGCGATLVTSVGPTTID